MAKIKQLPEDFFVKEINNVDAKGSGKFCYFILKKRDFNTIDAINEVADALKVSAKKFGFAGNKDKFAVTEQVCSVFGAGKERIEKLRFRDIWLEFLGYGDKPVSLGDLIGNEFEIVVRDLNEKEIDNFIDKIKDNKNKIKTINYFDEQRFSEVNVEVGRAIVKGEFENAANVVADGKGDYNKKVKEYLIKNKTDFVGALRLVPRKILLMFVHAYQSFLWNEAVGAYLLLKYKKNKSVDYSLGQFVFPLDINEAENKKIPIAGFGTEFKDKEIETIYNEILKKEKITLRDFIIRKIPEMSVEGNERDLVVDVDDFGYSIDEDDLNKGRKKVKIKFKLQKGSYATIVVKSLFEVE